MISEASSISSVAETNTMIKHISEKVKTITSELYSSNEEDNNKEIDEYKDKSNINDTNKNDKEEFLGQIIDCFEDFLDEKKVTFNNPERDETIADDNDSTAIIYGSDYDKLSESIESILNNWGMI